jgi:hypothetical protein
MPIFDYADFVWGVKNNSVLMNNLQVLHNKASKIILDAHPLGVSLRIPTIVKLAAVNNT